MSNFAKERAGSTLASSSRMMTDEQTVTDWSAILEEAGAKVCVACGSRAAIRAEISDPPARQSSVITLDDAEWVCFECGHRE
jgi:hypothetical protein